MPTQLPVDIIFLSVWWASLYNSISFPVEPKETSCHEQKRSSWKAQKYQTSRRTFLGLLKTRSSNVFPTTICMLASFCNLHICKDIRRSRWIADKETSKNDEKKLVKYECRKDSHYLVLSVTWSKEKEHHPEALGRTPKKSPFRTRLKLSKQISFQRKVLIGKEEKNVTSMLVGVGSDGNKNFELILLSNAVTYMNKNNNR